MSNNFCEKDEMYFKIYGAGFLDDYDAKYLSSASSSEIYKFCLDLYRDENSQ